jgi:dTDP-4-dehydrorhamnose 3,5-epimerase
VEGLETVRFTPAGIQGVWVIDLEKRSDERGYFARAWCEREFADHGLSTRIAQVNVGASPQAGTLRGLHYQLAPHAEVKLARCPRGAVYDVAVDLRPESPTFRRWHGCELSAENGRMLYVPEGCAHGYLTLTDDAELMYFTSVPYAPDAARGVRHDDPAFSIAWPAPVRTISSADAGWPDFRVTPP